MSASNWAICPRCHSEDVAQLQKEIAEVSALYGVVSIEMFEQRRRAVLAKEVVCDSTFREDYGVYGAEEGAIKFFYSGSCTECGLSVALDASKRFWPLTNASEAGTLQES